MAQACSQRCGTHHAGRWIIRVQDREPVTRQGFEQATFSRAVRLEAAVEVDVLRAEVGKHPDLEARPAHTIELQRVRAGLQDRYLNTRCEHLSKRGLDD